MALRKRVLSIIVIITILSILSSAVVFWEEIYSLYGYSKAALSYYGSTGQEVKNIQYKLAIWKYYNGKIDGIYGYKTYMAVRKFQAKNGLKVDGIAGPETLAALGLPTGQAAKATSASRQATGIWIFLPTSFTAKRGRALYRTSGSCSSCHQQDKGQQISQHNSRCYLSTRRI